MVLQNIATGQSSTLLEVHLFVHTDCREATAQHAECLYCVIYEFASAGKQELRDGTSTCQSSRHPCSEFIFLIISHQRQVPCRQLQPHIAYKNLSSFPPPRYQKDRHTTEPQCSQMAETVKQNKHTIQTILPLALKQEGSFSRRV